MKSMADGQGMAVNSDTSKSNADSFVILPPAWDNDKRTRFMEFELTALNRLTWAGNN